MNDKTKPDCGCGRSPTGYCVGWHNLSEEKYKEKLADYKFAEWQRLAQETWNDSCTSERNQTDTK